LERIFELQAVGLLTMTYTWHPTGPALQYANTRLKRMIRKYMYIFFLP